VFESVVIVCMLVSKVLPSHRDPLPLFLELSGSFIFVVQFCVRNSIQRTITMMNRENQITAFRVCMLGCKVINSIMTVSYENAFFAVISTSCLSLVNLGLSSWAT